MKRSIFYRRLPAVLIIFSVTTGVTTVNAAVAPASFVEPAGWNVGDALTTSQTWDAFGTSIDLLGGVPDVSFNDAGGELASPTVAVGSPAFIAGSGDPYSFSGNYTLTANISNHTAGTPASAGTHVIVQTFATIGPGDDQGNTGTVFDALISGAPTAELLRFDTFGHVEDVPASFGLVDAQATIHEFWLPDFTGDFSVVLDVLVHSSFDQLRIDTAIVTTAPDGSSPYAVTPVPEPAGLALLSVGAGWLALRRR